MNVDKVRSEIKSKEGKILHFKFNGSRNQIVEFEGEIIETYQAIFVVKLTDNNIKSFSYSDLITSSLEIFK
ncbi:MAG TPA: Veg family protein [Candidatus Onthousia faecipullorum]|uniref:Veg family protein n=1 Tax=Candidatus Onthousia faecipullorum TaxID=2840887 RepID=A0A9D1GBY1_9FIRM|nr:Veg family protein [Candidatus Onthousia faecipullorum]